MATLSPPPIATRLLLGLALASIAQNARADLLTDKINAAAAGLITHQDPSTNLWNSGFQSFNGTILSGLVRAFANTSNSTYRTHAESGATSMITFYLNNSEFAGRYLPDEVFSLTQLSSLQANPASNAYRTAASTFFTTAVPAYTGGTTGYINAISTQYSDPSHSVIDLAYLTVAAYAVNAGTRTQYRTALLSSLGNVTDAGSFPTASLGAALWALSQTTPGITGNVSNGSGPLANKTLASLPGILDARLDPSTKIFNWTLANPNLGSTEDTAFALMGLQAAAPGTYTADIQASMLALSGAITAGTGVTRYDPLNAASVTADVYAARALQALNPIPIPEPGTLAPLALGALGLLARRRKTH